MRFVLVSTHVDQTTGYSKVAYNLLKQLTKLAPAVKTYHFGFQRHPKREFVRKVPTGIVAYDAAANEDPKEEGFGFNKIHEYLEMVNPDIVMIYNDPLIIHRFIEAMKFKKGETPYKLWLYVDQVYEGIAPPLIETMNKNADRIYCFTQSWEDVYRKYGPAADLSILEHAVDSSVFSKVTPSVRNSIRARMNMSSDSVLFLNVNRNSFRKRLDLAIMGFVRLLKQDTTKPYYMLFVTSINVNQGAYYDVARIYNTELIANGLSVEELGKRMIIVDTGDMNNKALSDDTINELYNACDIGINTSDGEGFGLCQIEHLYTGAPQVVTDIGTYRSFLDTSVAEFIPAGPRCYTAGTMPLGLWAPTFSPDDVADAMGRAIDTLSSKTENASKYTFKTWDTVCASWLDDVRNANSSK